jgi:hypothetical protein
VTAVHNQAYLYLRQRKEPLDINIRLCIIFNETLDVLAYSKVLKGKEETITKTLGAGKDSLHGKDNL